MTKRYVTMRVPRETHDTFQGIKLNLETNILNLTGKKVKMPMTKIFKIITDPKYNASLFNMDARELLNRTPKKGRRNV